MEPQAAPDGLRMAGRGRERTVESMTTRQRERILIAGGGVAAVEAVAALRALAGPLPHITLLAPETQMAQRQASVGAPFGFGAPGPLPLREIARRAPFELRVGSLAEVDPGTYTVRTHWDETISYDTLIVAVGGRAEPAVEGAITFTGPAEAAKVAEAVEDADRIVFVQPFASGWSLPVYELAIMAAVQRTGTQITVVTAETAPLWVFGEQAGSAVRELLSARGIALRTATRAVTARAGRLELGDGDSIPADAVVALPRITGPAIAGLPHDRNGFIPVDAHGAVRDLAGVYAAGDATAFPLKQGGLATQQADAVAEAIAVRLGVPVVAEPFRPVLRGLLLTGGAPLYLRAQLGTVGADTARRLPVAAVSRRALWWPPTKVAGRYLAPLLATARPPVLASAPLQDLPERPPRDDTADALELALLLAEQDAEVGDFKQAVHALDVAAALTGGVLPAGWALRREAWLAGHA
jgi:sulfide:quinone oxidoreductase